MKYFIILNLLFLLNLSALGNLKKDSLPDVNKPKIGLLLSGGGAKGFAHIGVLKIIDQLGIPIDYIAGTSMGSIIGGFYALGYTANQIEEMALQQNWNQLLTDEISRQYIPFHEKQNYKRYVLSFPIKPKGVQMPKSIVHGQNVINLFERLSVGYHHVSDFNQLPIPFLCVATDMETGKPVVLNQGYLPEAMRASMAIPTMFSPTELDGKLLVDGGIANNFPARELIKMGADIIIGVDVQGNPKSRKDLNSFLDIIGQTITFMVLKEFENEIDLVDFYIKPNVDNYSMGSFNQLDSLIAKGEEAAVKLMPQLEKLKEKYNLKAPEIERRTYPSDTTQLYVEKIEVEGLNDLSKSVLLGKLKFDVPGNIKMEQLRKGIERGYGSQYFDQIDFKMLHQNNSLQLRVKERNSKRFNVGLRYDSDNKAGVLLNTTFRNKIRSGSLLSLDLKLAESPRFVGSYTIDRGPKPGFTLRAEYSDRNMITYENWKQVGTYDLDDLKLDFKIHSVLKDVYAISLGAKAEYISVKDKFTLPDSKKPDEDDFFISYYASLNLDTHEKSYYPRKGTSLLAEYKFITNDGVKLSETEQLSSVAYLKFQHALSLTERFTVYPKLYGRVIFGENIPSFFLSYTGGIDQTDYFDIQVPFVGLERMEVSSTNSFAFRCDFQYELFRNNYLILKANVGKLTEDIRGSSIKRGEWINGFALTYSYNSLIGPMEFSLMYSGKKKKLLNYISLGYWF